MKRTWRLGYQSLAAALSCSLLLPGIVAADQVGGREIVVPEEEVVVDRKEVVDCDCDDSPNQGNVSISAGLDVPTAYFFRGILQERDGGIFWPYAELGITLWENDSGQSLSLLGGIWNSVHTNKTGASGSGPSNWYEADIYGGLSLGLTDFLSTDLVYIAHTSPNGAFATIQEFDAVVSIDDSQWMPENFSISPYMRWAFELDNTAFGPDEGIYLELGAEPSYVFAAESDYPVTLSLPLSLGLSVDDYYEVVQPNGSKSDDTFGYFDFGVGLGVPLSFIDPSYGSWSVSAAFHGISLSGDLADVNRGDGFFPWGVAGIAMEY